MKVIGMITDRDICMAVGTRRRSAEHIAVRDVTHDRIYSCGPQDDTASALKMRGWLVGTQSSSSLKSDS